MPAEYGDDELPYPLPTEAPDGPGAFLALIIKLSEALDTATALPSGRLKRGASVQTLANAAATHLTAGLQTDYADGVTAGSGTLTIVTPGRYRVSAGLGIEANGSGARYVYVTKNGTGIDKAIAFGSAAALTAGHATPTATTLVTLAAGDILRVVYYQDSGSARPLLLSADALPATYLEVEMVAP